MVLVLFTEQYCSDCNIKLLHGNISKAAIKKIEIEDASSKQKEKME